MAFSANGTRRLRMPLFSRLRDDDGVNPYRVRPVVSDNDYIPSSTSELWRGRRRR